MHKVTPKKALYPADARQREVEMSDDDDAELDQSRATPSAGAATLDGWLESLELEQYAAAFREAGYTTLRFVLGAELDDIVAEVSMKRPHARVFVAAWQELVDASFADSSAVQLQLREPEPAEAEALDGIGCAAALAARVQRAEALDRSEFENTPDTPFFGRGDEEDASERASLLQQTAPLPSPVEPVTVNPARSRSAMEAADFRAEITTRLMGEVNTAIEAATAPNPGTPQTAEQANTSMQAISSTIRSILATAGATPSEAEPEPELEPTSLPVDDQPAPAPSSLARSLQGVLQQEAVEGGGGSDVGSIWAAGRPGSSPHDFGKNVDFALKCLDFVLKAVRFLYRKRWI